MIKSLIEIGIMNDNKTINLKKQIKNCDTLVDPWAIAFKKPIKAIIKNKTMEKILILPSMWVDLIFFYRDEFFSSLVFLPTAITIPIISLCLIVHPDQTVLSILIGSSKISPSWFFWSIHLNFAS